MLQETTGPEQIAPCEVEEKFYRIMTRNTKQSKDDSKREGKLLKERTPRTVLILGGKDVMSLLYTPKQIAILNVIV